MKNRPLVSLQVPIFGFELPGLGLVFCVHKGKKLFLYINLGAPKQGLALIQTLRFHRAADRLCSIGEAPNLDKSQPIRGMRYSGTYRKK